MNNIKVETKTNGYKAEGLQEMIARFEKVAAHLFPGCTVSHFYYGEYLDMADLIVRPGDCCHFNIKANRVSINGFAGTNEDYDKWIRMTYHDECYPGNLVELAEKI